MAISLQQRLRALRSDVRGQAPFFIATGLLGRRFSTEALDYFARLDSAGLRVGIYDAANARLIDRLVEAGGNLWPDSGAFNAMAGYLFPGVGANLVPLHPAHNAGTLNAFVTGDWNAVTGLKGDGSTKFVDSNRLGSADGLNDRSLGVYIADLASGGSLAGSLGSKLRDFISFESGNMATRSATSTGMSTTVTPVGYTVISRAIAASYVLRTTSTNFTITNATTEVAAENSAILRSAAGYSNARLPFYHIGPNLNGTGQLALLDTILTDWQADLASA